MTAVQSYDVFLSHAGADTDVVEQVAWRLKDEGICPWLDRWNVLEGDPFQGEIERALSEVATCAVFIGRAGIAGWVTEERDLALSRARRDPSFRVFAVLLPDAPNPIDPVSLGFLGNRRWLDLRAGLDDLDGLVAAIRGGARDVRPDGAAADDVRADPPYPGLAAFGPDDAAWFFGRDGEIQHLLEQMKSSRFLAVVGPSGSGKSSLVLAGLLPALAAGRVPGSSGWTRVVLRPGTRPLLELAAALGRLRPDRTLTALHDELADPRALDLHARSLFGGEPDGCLLLVIDQFEEVFTRCRDAREQAAFLGNVVEAATNVDGRVRIVLTLRSDFYSATADHPELARQVAGHQHAVAAMTREQLADAVEQPAHAAGATFEPGLVDVIVDDAVGRPGALPLLQHALRELWNLRVGRRLTHRAYTSIGGVDGALARRAEELYGGLDAGRQQLMRTWCTDLVQLIGDVAVSRPVRRDQLPGADDQGAARLLDELISQRLLSARAGSDQIAMVEFAHEALIAAWTRLQRWIAEDRDLLLWRQELQQSAQTWDERQRDRAYLYRGSRLRGALQRAHALADSLTEVEQPFLRASLRWERRRAVERYAGQGAAGALGAGGGLALAAAFGLLTPVELSGRALTLAVLAFATLGAVLGVVIGASLLLARGRQPLGLVAGALFGGVAGAVVNWTAIYAITLSAVNIDVALTGLLIGAPLGAAIGGTHRRRTRLAAAFVAGVLAMVLAQAVGIVSAPWLAVLAAGALLGGCVGLGFTAAHVEDESVAWVWEAS